MSASALGTTGILNAPSKKVPLSVWPCKIELLLAAINHTGRERALSTGQTDGEVSIVLIVWCQSLCIGYRGFTVSGNLPQQVLNKLAVFRRPPPSLLVGDVLGPLREPDERLEACHR